MRRVDLLWVEDETQHEMHGFIGPLFSSWQYKITIATNATEALDRIRRQPYDVVIVDIRIPPGEDVGWKELYNQNDADPATAKLGMVLLQALYLETPREKVPGDEAPVDLPDGVISGLGQIPSVDLSKFGVFSVEAEDLRPILEQMGIRNCLAKRARLPRLALVDFIEQISSGQVLGA